MADDNNNRGVLTFGEVEDGRIIGITGELLGIGRTLANELGEELSAVLMGSGISDLAGDIIALGAEKVYVVDDPLLENYQTDSYIAVMERLCREVRPTILLMGQTSMGRDMAPRLAFRLDTGLSMDCIELSIDPETKLMLQTRPVYGGSARAILVCESGRPQMATVREKSMSALERDDSRAGEVISFPAELDPSSLRVTFLERVKEEAEGIKLEDAEIIVSGGRGMGSAESFRTLEELAGVLKAAMGASRGACDSNYAPTSMQVGLTGKMVSPNLYIAVAISGASQHMAGCSGSRTIVAVNTDPDANIFKEARYGVVGDYRQVIPALTQKCRELMVD